MTENKMNLAELKKEYEKYKIKYNLPNFDELNKNFEIEKIERESDILLRIIRVVMMDKIMAGERFIDSLLSHTNIPRSLYGFIKSMSEEDKKSVDKLYDVFSSLSLEALELDVEYKEEREAEMIKRILDSWNNSKAILNTLFVKMRNPEKTISKREKSYFG